MTEVPKHLIQRANAARARAALERGHSQAKSPESGNNDPFERARTAEEQSAKRLLEAKAALVRAIAPVRRELEDVPTALSGQFVEADKLRIGYAFTPPKKHDTAATFTLYGIQETHISLPTEKSLRLGEEHAWRTLVPKREIGSFLINAGQRPLLDVFKLIRGYAVFADQEDIRPELAKRVFEQATAERVTTSAVLYEGNPRADEYSSSYNRRYGVSATIVRNPAATSEEEGIFGVDFLSFDGKMRVDEKPMDDGTKIDFERVGWADTFSRSFSPEEAVIGGLETATNIFHAYSTLVQQPTEQAMHKVYSATDRVLGGN